MNVTTELDHDPRTTGRGRFWAFVPVGLLAASLLGVGSMCSIAARDPAFALEKDYYQRAVQWNGEQAQWAENAKLGYRVDITSSPTPSGVELVARVLDRRNVPVRGAGVQAEAFANARAADRRTLPFIERNDGTYAASLPKPRPGLWELRVRVEQDGERFTKIVRTDLAPGRAP